MTYSLVWLSRVLKDAGLKVAAVPGWETRGNSDVGAIEGVMCHHTVGPKNGNMPSLGVLKDGRRDLQGPLAQLGLGRDGTFYIIAAGKANHAGEGEWKNIKTGNSSFIGIEGENTGINKPGNPNHDYPWPAIQMDAFHRGVAAILKHIGQNESMCCGHKEYALPRGRKIDPTFDMDDFRSNVAVILGGTAPVPTPIPRNDNKGHPTLRRGAKGDLVKEIQKKMGFVENSVDGEFGPLTEAAVRRFQRSKGLVPDGIVGPKTWAALDIG